MLSGGLTPRSRDYQTGIFLHLVSAETAADIGGNANNSIALA
jgi:hypothetical protein